MPPHSTGILPWVGAGLGLLRNPTEFFRRTRARLGDTFVVDAFGYRLFCVFSPEGVRRLYSLEEHEASEPGTHSESGRISAVNYDGEDQQCESGPCGSGSALPCCL